LGVPERPGKFIVWHNSGSYFVRNKYNRSWESGDVFYKLLRRRGNVLAAQKHVAKPKRQAIDHDDPFPPGFPPKRFGDSLRLFDNGPVCATRGSVASYPFCHFGIAWLRGRDQNWLQRRRLS
jgi:hypothetical protein